MPIGVGFGLLAALCWGLADFCARGASRSGGTFRTLFSIQVVACLALPAVGLPLGLIRLSNQPAGVILAAIALNLVILAGAGLLYRAFAIGTLALTSPIAASYAAITALLALLLSGEHPDVAQLAGIVLTLGGVLLASSVPGHPATAPARTVRFGPLRLAPGLLEAIGAMLLFGVAYWALRYVVAVLGGVTVAFLGKLGDLAVLSLIALIVPLVSRARGGKPSAPPRLPRPTPAFLAFVIPTALLDTTANVAYNLGIGAALTSLVSVLSSLFSPVTVLLAWIFLGERLSRWQWAGVAAIFAGVALVSM
jgi:drug/metabolite transporter (DMT)-like permease